MTRRTPLFKTGRNPLFKIGRNPLFKIERNPLFKTAVACLLSRGSGIHGKGKNPVNGYFSWKPPTHSGFSTLNK